MEGRRVKILDEWFGVVIQEGPNQSLVKITQAEPSLVGLERIFMNTDLKQENSDMPTVSELTAQYNVAAQAKGLPPVKKFKDRVTAERRLAAIGNGKADNNSGNLDINDIVNRFKFKKSKKPNLREKLLRKLGERPNALWSKKELGDLAQHVSGLQWGRKTRGITDVEIREEKKEGQWYYGLYKA